MNKEFAPVLVFAYRRSEHLKNTLAALNKSLISKETDIFIFCDHWKNDNDKNEVIKAWSVVDEFNNNNNFKNVVIRKSQENKGLAKSIIAGVSEVIDKYRKVIVVEDDLITSPYFLSYMNEALDFYKDNKKIWSVSGYTFFMRELKKTQHDVYFAGRCCSWGWATWNDRWEKTDWSMSGYDNFINNKREIKKFSEWGEDLPFLMKLQKEKKIDSWAIRWCYSSFTNGAVSVYPCKSLVSNQGLDGSGTHCTLPTKGFESYYFDDKRDFYFEPPYESKTIRKQFSIKYARKLSTRIIKKIYQIFKL